MLGKRAAEYEPEAAPALKKTNTSKDDRVSQATAFQKLCATHAVRNGRQDDKWSFWQPNLPIWTIDEIMHTLSAEEIEQQTQTINRDLLF